MILKLKKADELTEKLGQVIYVAGAQWGDEGKGKVVDILSQQYDIIVRAAGGANAGHTIVANNAEGEAVKFVFHLLPSGVLHKNKVCVIGHGTVIHIPTLLEEIQALKEQGIEVLDNILISDRAHLLFDFHKEIDGLQEEQKGENKVGTTKRGIGPAYTDKIARRGLRMVDLLNWNHFAEKFRENVELHQNIYDLEVDIEAELNYYKDAAEQLEPLITNTAYYLDQAYKKNESLLIEGAQGSHLDIDLGSYPYVTSSNTTSAGGCTGSGIAPNRIESVVGIAKAYTTRVGSGPFPTELGDMEGKMLRDQGGEYGATTGRPRRCGWFDAVLVKDAIAFNGINTINLTKLDVLSGFKTIKVATGYKLNAEPIPTVPASLTDFAQVEVDYEELEGWEEDLSAINDFDQLPTAAQKYVLRLEELLGVPVNFIGVGPHRKDMILK